MVRMSHDSGTISVQKTNRIERDFQIGGSFRRCHHHVGRDRSFAPFHSSDGPFKTVGFEDAPKQKVMWDPQSATRCGECIRAKPDSSGVESNVGNQTCLSD